MLFSLRMSQTVTWPPASVPDIHPPNGSRAETKEDNAVGIGQQKKSCIQTVHCASATKRERSKTDQCEQVPVESEAEKKHSKEKRRKNNVHFTPYYTQGVGSQLCDEAKEIEFQRKIHGEAGLLVRAVTSLMLQAFHIRIDKRFGNKWLIRTKQNHAIPGSYRCSITRQIELKELAGKFSQRLSTSRVFNFRNQIPTVTAPEATGLQTWRSDENGA